MYPYMRRCYNFVRILSTSIIASKIILTVIILMIKQRCWHLVNIWGNQGLGNSLVVYLISWVIWWRTGINLEMILLSLITGYVKILPMERAVILDMLLKFGVLVYNQQEMWSLHWFAKLRWLYCFGERKMICQQVEQLFIIVWGIESSSIFRCFR